VPLRLSDGPHRCAGRVEVFYENRWGTVCDDHWDLQDAGVVCRQLDCGTALSARRAGHVRPGTGPIWMDDVNCTGTEVALSHCRTKGWGRNNCNHGEDAGVVCSGDAPYLDEVRLVNGPNRCSGRVEVMHDHQWGTVCDDDWSFTDATVVCRQLDCGMAASAYGGARFGQGSGPIWLDNVECAGTEAALSECQARPWGVNNCHHGEDAGVTCTGTDDSGQRPLRLMNGSNSCLGRVEVFHDHKWGTICDDTWDLQDAAVVCRQLGCGTALSAPGSAHFGAGSDPIWLDDVHCAGTESTLAECELSNWGEHNCGHSEDASVVCSGTNPLQVRVRDGPSPCTGRLEVLYNATWHGVCGSSWSLLEAEVVCKQLDCGPAQSAPVGDHVGQGQTVLEGLSCRGTESLLMECQTSPPITRCGRVGANWGGDTWWDKRLLEKTEDTMTSSEA
ncbi:PREDICTED: soluble scavenger receptor cysteine-rich domain-containing protein SSC5D, partial [Buceros rhinoceros silvestris]|uniref:soluble scavenger receptor cysteine-rich domain-containing protein SSC5D n=1 Tax=Buceros rhinoceros silvestris TaxID=175836 RepID=UPI0005282C21